MPLGERKRKVEGTKGEVLFGDIVGCCGPLTMVERVATIRVYQELGKRKKKGRRRGKKATERSVLT